MLEQQITVLRYGHRETRDYRVTTHCCLVARAFGAQRIIIDGTTDESIKKSVTKVNDKWGGRFKIEFTDSWRKSLAKLKRGGFFAIHLTMYGQPIEKEEKKLAKRKKIAIIIGSHKVEKDVYWKSDANIAVTSQPHSEIAALAVALDRLQKGKELARQHSNAKIAIVPQEKGKKVIAKK